MNIINRIKKSILYHWYHHTDVPYLIFRILKGWQVQKKNKITVLFVIAELSAWKTELLYHKMVLHPRFNPIVGITTSLEVPSSKQQLIDYLSCEGINYIDLDTDKKSIDHIHPDLIFYYKPYDTSYKEEHRFYHHLSSLICFVNYAYNSMNTTKVIKQPMNYYAWKVFVENESVKMERAYIFGYLRSRNICVTGVPIQDTFLEGRLYPNPWKNKDSKKRIIYAPHHSIKGTNTFVYSTFLTFGRPMLDLAKKYKDKVQFAFKPHPTLYVKLIKIWGKEETDNYYNAWKEMENTQFENGVYSGLFQYSDAMIHDCASFTIEYHETRKPVMYLLDGESHNDDGLNEFATAAFNCHYKGQSIQDIELFINNVAQGIDEKKNERDNFIKKYLLPPNGKTACINIIDNILNNNNTCQA